ncbi:unnamed protein product [Linum tenue]|uniref:Uncharacterized protein n=1 Tax=Linum tenue TaxID=586396 RepID=A0AAV0QTL4_9ROSI|nr:unnamed protein product [Linum tenue]
MMSPKPIGDDRGSPNFRCAISVVPSIINGVITALYFSMWGKGLKSCGPVRTILAEYAGAVLGVLSAALYGQGKHLWKKVGGLVAMMLSFYLLSRGWAMATYSPFDILCHSVPSFYFKKGDCTTCFTQVLTRCVLITGVLQGSTSGSTSQLPFSAWAFGSFILFGVILIFYVDSIAEERLHMVFSSPRHLMVAGGCMIILEIFYQMDFSLPGFLICCLILGFGIYEATALERSKKGTEHFDPSEEMFEDMKSPLPT